MNITVRRAMPEDAAGIIAVFNPIILDGHFTAFDRPFTEEEERAFLEGLPARAFVHVALLDGGAGDIVRFQSVAPLEASMGAFDHVATIGTYVAMDQQRQGVGKALFAASFDAARTLGYEKIFTFVRADNAAGLAAYLGQGFEVVGRAQRQAKVRGAYVDEMMIERFL